MPNEVRANTAHVPARPPSTYLAARTHAVHHTCPHSTHPLSTPPRVRQFFAAQARPRAQSSPPGRRSRMLGISPPTMPISSRKLAAEAEAAAWAAEAWNEMETLREKKKIHDEVERRHALLEHARQEEEAHRIASLEASRYAMLNAPSALDYRQVAEARHAAAAQRRAVVAQAQAEHSQMYENATDDWLRSFQAERVQGRRERRHS